MGPFLSNAGYMNGVVFEILAQTPIPQLPPSYPTPHPPPSIEHSHGLFCSKFILWSLIRPNWMRLAKSDPANCDTLVDFVCASMLDHFFQVSFILESICFVHLNALLRYLVGYVWHWNHLRKIGLLVFLTLVCNEYFVVYLLILLVSLVCYAWFGSMWNGHVC